MSNAAQKQEMVSPQERIDALLSKETGNLWLKWWRMTPQERNEWRKGLGAAERTLLLHAIQNDCKKYVDEHKPPPVASTGPRLHKRVLNEAAKAATRRMNRLQKMWDKLSEVDRAALQDEVNHKFIETGQ